MRNLMLLFVLLGSTFMFGEEPKATEIEQLKIENAVQKIYLTNQQAQLLQAQLTESQRNIQAQQNALQTLLNDTKKGHKWGDDISFDFQQMKFVQTPKVEEKSTGKK